MTKNALTTRLKNADPAAGRDVADDPALRRARVDAILASEEPDPLAPHEAGGVPRPSVSGRRRYRRAAAIAVAAMAIPGAALAASAAFGPDDVERGLPAGAQLLVGTDPSCGEVEPGVVYDCKLGEAPTIDQAPDGSKPPWLGAVSLIVDRDGQINGGCRSQASDGTAWRCYIGNAAADQQILDPRLLGTPIHGHCENPPSDGPPVASPLSAAPDSAIILCGARDIVAFPATVARGSADGRPGG